MSVGHGAGHSDEHRREQREHHGLDEAYQALQAHHEDTHEDAHGTHAVEDARRHRGHEENDARHGHRNGMACHDVGKESDHQGKGLGEDAHELYHGDDGNRRLEPCGHVGPEDVLPVVLVARELHHDEGA